MRHGSTLVPGLMPDTRGMLTDQVLATPAGSAKYTIFRLLFLLGITLGFDFFLQYFVMGVFLACMVGNDMTDMRTHEHAAADILIAFATYQAFEPIIFCPAAFVISLSRP